MSKKYAVSRLREMEAIVASGDIGPMTRKTVAGMLRQAADAEDENAKLRETINADSASMAGKDAVIEQLKARLEAVVNMLANVNHECRYSNAVSMLKDEYDAIIRAARGEGGAE